MKERGDVVLVGLKLVVGRADVGIRRFWSLELDDNHRQTIKKITMSGRRFDEPTTVN